MRRLFLLVACITFSAGLLSGKGTECRDKDSNCDRSICRDYPFTAKERCAKTCGHCTPSSQHIPRDGAGQSCIDKDPDCTQQICSDRPYTAKQRCARTCGICELNERTGAHQAHVHDRDLYNGGTTSSRHSSTSPRGSLAGGHAAEGSCVDKEKGCTERSCLDRPFTAKTKCAKTCGFCGDDTGSRISLKTPSDDRAGGGSMISLKPDDELGHGQGRRPSTHLAGSSHETGSHSRHGSGSSISSSSWKHSTDLDRHGSTTSKHSVDTDRSRISSGSRHSFGTDSDRSAASSRSGSRHPSVTDRRGSVFDRTSTDIDRTFGAGATGHFTTPPTSSRHTGRPGKVRYAGREGPCRDDNRHCEKDDCTNFPYFSQRFCEKTCAYC